MADAELESILSDIKNAIQGVLNETQDLFAITVAASTYANVYAKYTSQAEVPYVQRMESGGLADKNNYEVVVGTLESTIINNTTGNAAYANATDGYDDGYITDIVESGSGYRWRNSEIYNNPIPRPFMEQGGDIYVDEILIPRIDAALTSLLGG